MTKNNLYEAKNIRGHRNVKQPWNSSALVATLGTLVGTQSRSLASNIAGRHYNNKFDSLQAAFQRELSVVFKAIKEGDTLSAKKMKGLFRKYYTSAFKMGLSVSKGRVITHSISPEDSRWLETYITKEFNFWKNFVKDIKKNEEKLTHLKRLEMYSATLRSMYTSAKVIHAPAHTVFYWKTTPGEKCSHCLFLAKMSPYTKENIPTVPASGDTKCLSNCRCHLEPKIVSMTKYMYIKSRNTARNELLRRMRRL